MLFALCYAAHAQDTFFQGKSVRVIRGGQTGDLYDLWTRHIATYLGKHIPGNPTVAVENMTRIESIPEMVSFNLRICDATFVVVSNAISDGSNSPFVLQDG